MNSFHFLSFALMGAFNVVIASVLLFTKRPLLVSARWMYLIFASLMSPMVVGEWINSVNDIESWTMRILVTSSVVCSWPFFRGYVVLYGLSDYESRRAAFNCIDRLGYSVRERLGKILIKEIGEEMSMSTGWPCSCRIQLVGKNSGQLLEVIVNELRKAFRDKPANINRSVCFQFLIIGILTMIFFVVLAIQFLPQF